MNNTIVRTHHYAVRITTPAGAVTRCILPRHPDHISDAVMELSGDPLNKVEYKLLGVGRPEYLDARGRAFWTFAQLVSYQRGRDGWAAPAHPAVDDMSYLGEADAERQRERAEERRAARSGS